MYLDLKNIIAIDYDDKVKTINVNENSYICEITLTSFRNKTFGENSFSLFRKIREEKKIHEYEITCFNSINYYIV